MEGSALDDRGVVEQEDRAEVGGRRNEALALVGVTVRVLGLGLGFGLGLGLG